MTISAADFWLVTTPDPDPWGGGSRVVDELDAGRLSALIAGPEAGVSDLDAGLALMDLVRDDFQHSGTEGSGSGRLTNDEMRMAVRALEKTTERAGQAFKLPFRDHTAWKSWWIRKGASGAGGWQARRSLLAELFDEPYAGLMAAQERALDSTLVEAASPLKALGWPAVDAELGELRRHFRSARTPQDYRAVGNDCVHVLEALSRQVYDHARHTPDGEQEPPVDKTKLRLERYVQDRLSGPGEAEMRKYARAAIELAQAVKHRGAPTRRDAGVMADAVIVLSNMLRRLDEEPGR
ncbi:hypothetical protein [Nocardioides ochotonae]|uniref:hypothetical protein n=1 Tax=Nocardioides ochotonae TaxID=2685869 RepID=UPI0014085DA4|nr:hypothetical protein [Nocardioides ochotonae]